jgi:glycosyltransferase involved in cell wall biosynthesis
MTHPTQYHAPWFRALAARPEISIHVYYGVQPSAELQGKDFGLEFEWDTPLLEGYSHSFLTSVVPHRGWQFGDIDTPELAGTIPRREFDTWIINGWTFKSEWQAIRACWKARVATMIRGDSTLLDPRPLHTRIAKRLLLGKWIPRFDRYLTVGRLNEKFYESYGADPNRFVPVRHFVDNELFASRAEQERMRKAELRRAWDIDEKSIVFLFAGKLMQKKKPVDAVRALARLTSRGRTPHLLIAGEGELRDACSAAAAKLGVGVSFAGFLNQSRMPEAYAAADVLVLPSAYQETWGLVVNEAMAAGLPAIVSDKVGCAPDLIIPGETGEVFPAGDIDAFASKMQKYLDTPEESRPQGARASQHISGYSLEAATENTVRAIVDVSSR